jgi:exosome complex component RRP46
MRYMFTSTIVAVMSKTTTRDYPTIKDATVAKSLHVLSFSSKGELLLAEGEGRFSMEDWKLVEERAKTRCLGDPDAMVEGEENGESLQTGLKSAIEEKVRVRRGGGWEDG